MGKAVRLTQAGSQYVKVKLKVDVSSAVKRLNATPAAMRRASASALNDAAVTARAEAARTIREVGYNLKISDIKNAITILKANPAKLFVTLDVKGKPIPLSKFGARAKGAGKNKGLVSVNVMGQRKTLKHLFMATMKSGHVGIFRRDPNAKHVSKKSHPTGPALPIHQAFGPSIADAFGNIRVQLPIQQTVRRRFAERMPYYVQRFMPKAS